MHKKTTSKTGSRFFVFKRQIIRKPGSVLADHLSSPNVATWIKRLCDELKAGTICLSSSPCSRQGLPFYNVTDVNCGLLPHSFHPYLVVTRTTRRYSFCGTFPRVAPGCC